jgi:hypothetical protein
MTLRYITDINIIVCKIAKQKMKTCHNVKLWFYQKNHNARGALPGQMRSSLQALIVYRSLEDSLWRFTIFCKGAWKSVLHYRLTGSLITRIIWTETWKFLLGTYILSDQLVNILLSKTCHYQDLKGGLVGVTRGFSLAPTRSHIPSIGQSFNLSDNNHTILK